MKTASDAVRTLGDRTPNENPSISPGPMTTISQEAPGGLKTVTPDEIQRTRRLDRRRYGYPKNSDSPTAPPSASTSDLDRTAADRLLRDIGLHLISTADT